MDIFREIWARVVLTAGEGVIASVAEVVKILIIYIVARGAIFAAIDRMLGPVIEHQTRGGNCARVKTLQGLLKSVVGYTLFFIAAVMMLRAFRVDPVPVLTTAGVVGLAVGFGAQRLVRDVISGFFILLENQFAVGEYVTMVGVTGTVEEIGMRITRIRDDAGKLNIIANGDITTVCNYSRGAVSVCVDISIHPNEEPVEVAELLNKSSSALIANRSDIITPLQYEGIVAMDAAKLTLRFSGKCTPGAIESVQMAMRERFRETLKAKGITLV